MWKSSQTCLPGEPGPFAASYNDACTSFANGKSAMYPCGRFAVPQILTGNPNVPNCSTPVGCYSTGEKISGYTVPGEDYPVQIVAHGQFLTGCLRVEVHQGEVRRVSLQQPVRRREGVVRPPGQVAPADQVQIIYSAVEKNTPVIIYG